MESKESFSEFAESEFNRINKRRIYRTRGVKTIPNISISTIYEGNLLTLVFSNEGVEQRVSFPIPQTDEFGNLTIGDEVIRSVGTWFLVDQEKEVDYWELMRVILSERIDCYFPELPGVGKRSQIEKVLVSFDYNRQHRVINNLQRIINNVINKLPICDTPMQTWAMNKRIVFVDPIFDKLVPEDLLEYQKEKNRKFFPWSTVGLSDSTMVKNYMIKKDLREYTPFGNKHHSPMRNLYQSLGMKGPDTPLIRTKSMAALEEKGITRGCWNWFTAFVDLPLNFEDQLMVHTKHQDEINTSEKRFLVFGTILVRPGENIEKGQTLSVEVGNKHLIFRCSCEEATVVSIEPTKLAIGGESVDGSIITISIKRSFKNGFKFTNLHGNKGIAVFCDTGTAYDTIRKVYRDIDIIVAAKTVGNRRNFGQIFEALATLLNGENKRLTIGDDCLADIEKIKGRLVKAGMPENGVCKIETPYGKLFAICGWVAWGLLKEPEDAVWVKSDVLRNNTVGIRVCGNKISHIEFRALNTIFGAGNALSKEILTYQEGADVVDEFTKIVESSVGVCHKNIPCMPHGVFTPPVVHKNFLKDISSFAKTVSDISIYKDGVYLKLPVDYYTFVPKDYSEPIENVAVVAGKNAPRFGEGKVHKTNKIYVPFTELRAPWQHRCGLWGTSELSESINSIIRVLQEYSSGESSLVDITIILERFFSVAAKKLSTKKGFIATHCLAVRYPHSAKATAAVSDKLPKNIIEIHKDMARDLGVEHGDYVLVERFPCLGFMSMRVQQIRVVEDASKKFVITVSGSSLNSQGLDFDGDTLHIVAFKTPEAKDELEYEFRFPNPVTAGFINEASDKKVPRVWEASLDTFVKMGLDNGMPPMSFAKVTPETQAEIAGALTSIKTGTGTSVALGYNLCRIAEGAFGYDDSELSAGIEMILDKTANSVFNSKHRITALLEKE